MDKITCPSLYCMNGPARWTFYVPDKSAVVASFYQGVASNMKDSSWPLYQAFGSLSL